MAQSESSTVMMSQEKKNAPPCLQGVIEQQDKAKQAIQVVATHHEAIHTLTKLNSSFPTAGKLAITAPLINNLV